MGLADEAIWNSLMDRSAERALWVHKFQCLELQGHAQEAAAFYARAARGSDQVLMALGTGAGMCSSELGGLGRTAMQQPGSHTAVDAAEAPCQLPADRPGAVCDGGAWQLPKKTFKPTCGLGQQRSSDDSGSRRSMSSWAQFSEADEDSENCADSIRHGIELPGDRADSPAAGSFASMASGANRVARKQDWKVRSQLSRLSERLRLSAWLLGWILGLPNPCSHHQLTRRHHQCQCPAFSG